MICMLFLFYCLCSLVFLVFVHPLWLSLVVFVSSIMMALLKFYQVYEVGMFSYLFILVYSGGLLLLLVYVSSLVPNNNLIMEKMLFLGFIGFLLYSMYSSSEFLIYNFLYFFSSNTFLGMSYFMNHKELIYALIFLLMLGFCLISYVMSVLKYPMRSL
uniref:NADH dehydrogenase subunit 6 n=1 Tax=Trichuris sp. LO613 TaxID=2856030 RepID=A0A8F5HTV2_9BILA|nr:NADH dehydrogenase subunit 6 [Trichuris sp. LO613]